MSDLHPLDQTIALTPEGDGFTGYITPDWGNMIGPFGGAIAAVILNAVLQRDDVLGEPVSMTVNYAAPIADKPFWVVPVPLHTGRSSQHWQVVLRQGEGPLITATVITAVRKETWSHTELAMPEAPAPEDVEVFPQLPVLPVWTRNYDFRFIHGQVGVPDGRGAESSETLLWLNDKRGRPLDFPSLALMADSFYPRIYLRMQALVPSSTVTMSTYFHAGLAELQKQGSQPLLVRGVGTRFFNGFFDQRGEFWGSDGELLCTTSQLVFYRA